MTAATLPSTGTPISTDLLNASTGLNGGAPTASEQTQVFKVSFGSVGFARYVDAANGLPISGAVTANQPANTSVGPTAFTAGDAVVAAPIGDGTLVSGTSTSGSIVSIPIPSGYTAWTALIKNWNNGTIYSEASFNSTDGTNGDWVEVKGRRTGTAPGTESVVYAFVANGYYRGNGAGFTYYRLRFIGASTFPTAQIVLSNAMGATFLNSGIPQGSSVIGAVAQSGTWNIGSITTMPTTPVTGTFFQATQPVSIAAAVAVTQAALTKGTQGAAGVTVQDLKDAGRNLTTLRMDIPVVTTATDALQSLTGFKGGAAVTAITTPAVVTAGKTFRIQTISMTYVAIATAGTAKFTIRANTGGVVAIASPAVLTAIIGGPAAVAGVSQTYELAVPDGMEFAAGTGIGVSMVGLSAIQAAAAVGYGQISIVGYEY